MQRGESSNDVGKAGRDVGAEFLAENLDWTPLLSRGTSGSMSFGELWLLAELLSICWLSGVCLL